MNTAKEVRAFFAKHGPPLSIDVVAGDKTDLTSAYETKDWDLIIKFSDGATLTISWSGYIQGYSEYTPSSPGYIYFLPKEPE